MQAHTARKANLKRLVQEGRFEILTGGWVMTDEANVHIYSMVDQLIEGIVHLTPIKIQSILMNILDPLLKLLIKCTYQF